MEKLLGSGLFGKVYLVENLKSGQKFALKVLQKHHEDLPDVSDVGLVDSFRREFLIQNKLDHPNILKTFGIFEDLDRIYLLLVSASLLLQLPVENLGRQLSHEIKNDS